MSSRLNPREYDVVELRDALRVTQGRPGKSGSDCGGSDRPDGLSESGNPDGDVWMSASELGHDRTFGNGSSTSEHPEKMTDDDGQFRPPDESRPEAPRVRRAGERSAHPADGGEGVHTSSRRSKSSPDRSRDPSPESRQDLEPERSRGSTRPDDPGVIPLAQLPTSVAGQMEILDWLEKLLSVCSQEEALDALKYYRSIGWLSAESYEQLRTVLEGLDSAGPTDPEPLRVDDHRESLQHIAALARFR